MRIKVRKRVAVAGGDTGPQVAREYSAIRGEAGRTVLTLIAGQVDPSRPTEGSARESERRHRSLFEHMLEGYAYGRMIFEDDEPQDFIYLDVNRAFEELTGLKDVIGKRATEVIPGIKESNPELFEIYGRVARTGRPMQFEARFESLQGLWLSIAVYRPEPDCFVAVYTDITDRKMAEFELRASFETLRQADAQRRRLLTALVSAQEGERALIAGEIHDDSVQVMTAVGMRLALLVEPLAGTVHEEALGELEKTVSLAIHRLRNLLFSLRPKILDEQGLAAALVEQAERMKEQTEASINVTAELAAEPPDSCRIVVFRVVQEALSNACKHAGATTIDVVVSERDGGLHALVRDDGVGFSPNDAASIGPDHLGLVTMRERAELSGGRLEIRSRPGAGTEVEVWTPETPPAFVRMSLR